jgi:adenosylcobinamide-GDP ribazoletransferase
LLKTAIKRLVLSIQFFTVIPIRKEIKSKNYDYGKLMAFLPLIGLVLGIILFFIYNLLKNYFSPVVSSVLIIIFYVFLSGGLHIDGLGDTFDGIFSNRTKDRILEIMKDSRMGTNGILAIFFILILNIILLSELMIENNFFIILFPVAGRTAGLICSSISVYARTNGGLGKNFVEYCNFQELIIGLFFHFLINFLLFHNDFILALISISFPIIFAFLITKYFSNKINGVTGDIIGAIIEISQTFYIFISYLYIFNLR